MRFFIIIFFILIWQRAYCADLNKCILADKVSRDFSFVAVENKADKAWNMISPNSDLKKNKKIFNKHLKQQFKKLLGKEVYHSLSTFGLIGAQCTKDKKGNWQFRDHRVLLHFGKNNVEVLPMHIEVHLIKSIGWKIYNFRSTAL